MGHHRDNRLLVNLLLSCTVLFPHIECKKTPLYLTPLLEENKISEAKELSEVRDPDNQIPKSYAGLITVDKVLRNHLFFWFFPAFCSHEAPILVWLNGGPTISLMVGMAWENGPIRVQGAAEPNANVTYKKWDHSWTQNFSMLYIDNPVGVGYSFTESGENGYRTTQDGYSGDLFSFIEQFYVMFPEYLDQELYIGGQSYAGKYVPAFAYRIHQEITAGKSSVPLTGIYLGGPYFDPQTESEAFNEYYYSMGAITYPQLAKAKEDVTELFECLDKGKLNLESWSDVGDVLFPSLNVEGYSRDNYLTLEMPGYYQVQNFMNLETTREMIHIGEALNFSIMNEELMDKFLLDVLLSTKSKMAELLNNYKVLIYTGDLDGIVTSVMVDRALASTPWSLQAQYNASERSPWSKQGHLKGFYNHVGEFCRVVIRGAGHQVPFDQPVVTIDMMNQFIQDGCVRDN